MRIAFILSSFLGNFLGNFLDYSSISKYESRFIRIILFRIFLKSGCLLIEKPNSNLNVLNR